MAIKVQRTHGLRVLMEKCGCKATREYEDAQLTKPVGDAPTFVACAKHEVTEEARTTIQEILFEMLETAQGQAQKMPVPNAHLGHSIQDVEAAQAAGGTSATRTTIRRAGSGAGRTSVRRAGGSGDGLSGVSQAVLESRASGSTSAIDAELARAPEPTSGVRLGPISREKVQEIMEEAAESGDTITPLDVILGANDVPNT